MKTHFPHSWGRFHQHFPHSFYAAIGKSAFCSRYMKLVPRDQFYTSQPENNFKIGLAGVRSPDLQNGGDLQFVMMENDNFMYDSSMPSKAFGSVNIGKGLWPYTFDYESIQVSQLELITNFLKNARKEGEIWTFSKRN